MREYYEELWQRLPDPLESPDFELRRRFLLEEVGLDGIYIDEFNQAWNRSVRSYSGWDGVSVEINPQTGEIARKYVSCGLAGIPSRPGMPESIRPIQMAR